MRDDTTQRKAGKAARANSGSLPVSSDPLQLCRRELGGGLRSRVRHMNTRAVSKRAFDSVAISGESFVETSRASHSISVRRMVSMSRCRITTKVE